MQRSHASEHGAYSCDDSGGRQGRLQRQAAYAWHTRAVRGDVDAHRAEFTIDSPLVSVVAERGPKGDRYQLTLASWPEALVVGEVAATPIIETNDAELPKLEVPVRGTILAK